MVILIVHILKPSENLKPELAISYDAYKRKWEFTVSHRSKLNCIKKLYISCPAILIF